MEKIREQLRGDLRNSQSLKDFSNSELKIFIQLIVIITIRCHKIHRATSSPLNTNFVSIDTYPPFCLPWSFQWFFLLEPPIAEHDFQLWPFSVPRVPLVCPLVPVFFCSSFIPQLFPVLLLFFSPPTASFPLLSLLLLFSSPLTLFSLVPSFW